MTRVAEARRRAKYCGLDAVEDGDLLAILGVAEERIPYGSLNAAGLRSQGITDAQAFRLLAAIEIGRRVERQQTNATHQPLRGSGDVDAMMRPRIGHLQHEVFYVLALDTRGRVIASRELARGGMEDCNVDSRRVFRLLLGLGAAACIVVHNHPSGSPDPSHQDRMLTIRLAEAGRLLGIRLLDHVIVARKGFHSFRDDGQL